MASLDTLGLAAGGKLEVEVYFTIEISVDGRGAGYNNNVEVSPEESMLSIESRVFFFKMFRQRGFQLYAPELDRVFEYEELAGTLFRDSSLKNNSKLVLRQPPKPKGEGDGTESEDLDEMLLMDEGFEGGEDELVDMDEEGEVEIDEPPPGAVPEDPEAEGDDAKAKPDQKKESSDANGKASDADNGKADQADDG